MRRVLHLGEEGAVQVQEDARSGANVGQLPKRRPCLRPCEAARRDACVHHVPKKAGQTRVRAVGKPDQAAGLVAE